MLKPMSDMVFVRSKGVMLELMLLKRKGIKGGCNYLANAPDECWKTTRQSTFSHCRMQTEAS
jgi:hypothetical protein